MPSTLTLFTRKRCSLCDKAYEALARVREAHPFDLAVIDLDLEAAPEKKAAYDQYGHAGVDPNMGAGRGGPGGRREAVASPNRFLRLTQLY